MYENMATEISMLPGDNPLDRCLNSKNHHLLAVKNANSQQNLINHLEYLNPRPHTEHPVFASRIWDLEFCVWNLYSYYSKNLSNSQEGQLSRVLLFF